MKDAPRTQWKAKGAFLLLLSLLMAFAGVLAACLPEPTPEPTPLPTGTAQPSPTSTATVMWFPATPTFTPFPTRELQPTYEMAPGLGAVLLQDDFLNTALWPTLHSDIGNVAYGRGELTLVVNSPKGMVSTLLPKQRFSDFYMEVDSLPSLCRGKDTFGLLFRSASESETYRLMVNCAGQVRVEREKSYTVVPLQDWTVSGQVLPDMLLKSHLAVWTDGNEMRIFINGVYQFSVRDPALTEGLIGFFARSGADTPLTVSFSKLKVSLVDPSQVPTLVPTPTLTLRPTATRRPTATTQP